MVYYPQSSLKPKDSAAMNRRTDVNCPSFDGQNTSRKRDGSKAGNTAGCGVCIRVSA